MSALGLNTMSESNRDAVNIDWDCTYYLLKINGCITIGLDMNVFSSKWF